MSNKPVYIYAIINPLDNSCIYVGASMHVISRYNIHSIAGEWHPITKRYKIVKGLNRMGLKPLLIILEECNAFDAKEREQFYINHYLSIGQLYDQAKVSTYPKNKMNRAETIAYYKEYRIAEAKRKERIKNIPEIAKIFLGK